MVNRRIVIIGLAKLSALAHVRAAQGQTPAPSQPPRMLLRASGGEQLAAIGTYCRGSKCVDMASPFSFPACPLPVLEGELLTLGFASLGPLRRLRLTIWPYAEDIQPGPPDWSAKTSDSPAYEDVAVRPVSPILLPGVLPLGLFVAEVFAQARGSGSTNQGFTLLVSKPAAVTPTPATPMTMPIPVATCGEKEG